MMCTGGMHKLHGMAWGKSGKLFLVATIAVACWRAADAALVKHDIIVTAVIHSPDCFPKWVIIANGQWQYPITVTQGDTLQVSGPMK